MPASGAAGALPGDGGRPRQDGGPLGAQLLGRWLGAPVGPQRVSGGDGEAALRAGAMGWLAAGSWGRAGRLERLVLPAWQRCSGGGEGRRAPRPPPF